MANVRDYESLGVFATDAETTIPAEPISGVAYRNTALSKATNETGEEYDTVPDSANFNQKMFSISSFTDTLAEHGVIGWSDQQDYTLPALVYGSDDNFYLALQNSGPAGVGAKDPTTEPTYWKLLVSAADVEAELDQYKLDIANQTDPSQGTKLVGHTSQTAFQAIEARPTSATLQAPGGATLIGSTDGDVQSDINTLKAYGSIVVHGRQTSATSTPALASGSLNVSSIVQDSTGLYTINFTSALPNSDYTATAGNITTSDSAGSDIASPLSFDRTTTSFRVKTTSDNGVKTDSSFWISVIL